MRALALVAAVLALLVAPATAPAAISAGDTGWVWANPLPQGDDIEAIDFVGAHGIAVGAHGLILRTEDGGVTWTRSPSDTDATLTEVALPNADTVYAGGGCVLRRSSDGGQTFGRVRFAARESKCGSRLAQIAFPSALVGYLVMTDGKVLRTANGGRSFARRSTLNIGSSVDQGGPTDVVFIRENTGVVSTGLSTPSFLRTVDNGQTWTPITPMTPTPFPHQTFTRVRDLEFVTPSLGYTVANGGDAKMAKTEDGGVTWTPLALTGAAANFIPHGINCGSATACAIFGSTEFGDNAARRVTWTADGGLTGTTIATDPALLGLAFSSPTHAVAAGVAGAMLASGTAGQSFARIGGGVPGDFRALRRAGANTVLTFASDGSIARSLDRGLTWQAIGSAPLGGLLDISFASDTVGYILAKGGALQRTDDSGASWSVLAEQVDRARAIVSTGVDTLLVGTADGVERSTDGGTTFAPAAGARRRVVAFDRAGKTLVAYGPKTLLASGDGGARWHSVRRPRGGPLASVDFVSARRGFAVRDDGETLWTASGGRRWTLLTSVGRDDVTGVSFGDPRHGYLTLSADSDFGGLLRTSDGGRTWRPQVIAHHELARVVALGKSGGVAVTEGFGQLFATTHGGDAGRSSRLGLRVQSKRRQRGRTVVVVGGQLKPAPAGAGVSVTAHIGGSWVRKFAQVDAKGRYRTAWRLRRGTVFVAQYRGGDGVQADGTTPLRVRVGGRRHR
jgi:photosystem II stability/assembly factor-like uncharacterized protein